MKRPASAPLVQWPAGDRLRGKSVDDPISRRYVQVLLGRVVIESTKEDGLVELKRSRATSLAAFSRSLNRARRDITRA
jgi:hypothetical protein